MASMSDTSSSAVAAASSLGVTTTALPAAIAATIGPSINCTG